MWYGYFFWNAGKVVWAGITTDLDRREGEHRDTGKPAIDRIIRGSDLSADKGERPRMGHSDICRCFNLTEYA